MDFFIYLVPSAMVVGLIFGLAFGIVGSVIWRRPEGVQGISNVKVILVALLFSLAFAAFVFLGTAGDKALQAVEYCKAQQGTCGIDFDTFSRKTTPPL